MPACVTLCRACGLCCNATSACTHATAKARSDGRWRVSRHEHAVPGRQPRVPASWLVTIEVNANAFQFRWDPRTWVDATIAADGTVTGGAESITLVGRLTGSRIEGDVTNGNCGLHFTVTKRS